MTPTTSKDVSVILHLAADRILRSPQALRQAGGDDGDLSIAVLLFEIAAIAQTDAERLKISGTDEAHVGGGEFHHGPGVVFLADDVDPGFAHQRQGRYDRGILHAGHVGSLFEHTLEERGAFGRLGVLGGEQREIHGEYAIHLKALVDRHETDEAGDEQSGGDEQRGAEAYFEADQEVAHAQSAAAFGIAAARRFQGLHRDGPHAAQGGKGAKDEAGEQRDGEREEEHVRVHMDFLQARQIDWRGGQQGAHAPVGQDHAERSAGEREQCAFGNRLGKKAPAAGAEGGAYGRIARATGGARQRKVGQIDAEDKKHGADRGHEEDESLSDVADHALLERDESGVQVEIARDLFADGGLHHVEFRLRAGGRDCRAADGRWPRS